MKQRITVIAVVALCGMSFWIPGTASAAEQEQDTSISDELLTEIETEIEQEQSAHLDEEKTLEIDTEEKDIELSEQSSETEESMTESGSEEDSEKNAIETAGEEKSQEDEPDDDLRKEETDTEENESPECQDSTELDGMEELTDRLDESGEIEKRWKAGTRLTSLQMPQKFEIMMDPFEMDKRTQVYSKEYKISNTGEFTGTLKLTGIANEAGDNVSVCAERDNVHDGKNKNIFIELVINGEERVVLSPEGTDYEILLESNEELTLEFVGEMNEKSLEEWQDSDVKITVIYDWKIEPEEEMTEEETDREQTEEETTEEESMTEEISEEESSSEQEDNAGITSTEEESQSIPENETTTEESEKITEEISEEEEPEKTTEENSDENTERITEENSDEKESSLEETGTMDDQTETQQEDTEAEAENEQKD